MGDQYDKHGNRSAARTKPEEYQKTPSEMDLSTVVI